MSSPSLDRRIFVKSQALNEIKARWKLILLHQKEKKFLHDDYYIRYTIPFTSRDSQRHDKHLNIFILTFQRSYVVETTSRATTEDTFQRYFSEILFRSHHHENVSKKMKKKGKDRRVGGRKETDEDEYWWTWKRVHDIWPSSIGDFQCVVNFWEKNFVRKKKLIKWHIRKCIKSKKNFCNTM